MNAVIKSKIGSQAAIRPFGGSASPRPAPLADPQLLALRAEVAALEEKLAEREAAISAHGPALERAKSQGEAAGREAALQEADDGRTALIGLVTEAARTALERLSNELSSLERLAPLLAIEGLEKVFGPSETRSDQMERLLRHQLQQIAGRTVIRVEVSHEDFADEDALAELREAAGAERLAVSADRTLASGDCRLVLQLGSLDVGLNQQWGRLREVLADLAEPMVDV